MAILTKSVNNALVWYPSDKPQRWLDAVGENVIKYASHFGNAGIGSADTVAGWTTTLVEAGGDESTITSTDVLGGRLLLKTDANEDDGPSMQLSGASFKLSGQNPAYFGIKFKVNVATQVDFMTGLCVTDTAILGGVTEGMYFRKVDGTTNVEFVTEIGSVESSTIIDTFVADTDYTYEIYFDGENAYVYLDNVLILTVDKTIATFPDTSLLTPSVELLSGVVTTQDEMSIDWLRAFQCF